MKISTSPKQSELKRYLKSIEGMIPCGLYTSSKFKNDLLSLRIREKMQEQNLT